ncbi:MAG: hypothetical protein V1838_00970 [Patescibacteria group bacterium]
MSEPKEIIPIEDNDEFTRYLQKSNTEKASDLLALTSAAVSAGKSGVVLSIGRIAQGIVKGKFIQTLKEEISDLIKKGKIKEDFWEKMRNFHSFTELLTFIDSENPDEERFNAAKAMFYSLITIDEDMGREILSYNLFKISLNLSATQILILNACFQERNNYPANIKNNLATVWREYIAKKLGGVPVFLIINEEKQLVEVNLLSGYVYQDQSGIHVKDARLTELGILFCDNLSKFK